MFYLAGALTERRLLALERYSMSALSWRRIYKDAACSMFLSPVEEKRARFIFIAAISRILQASDCAFEAASSKNAKCS
jgi:hypothetical protein